MGPMFRHERPQRGRYRQFHQVGVEALGFPGPDIDAEHIVMLARLWKILGIGPVRLEINCLGPGGRAGAPSRGPDRAFRSASRRRSTRTRSAGCTPIRCASSTPRIPRCRRREAGAADHRVPRRRVQGALRRAAAPVDARRHSVPGQPAAGARPRLLQPDRVRVDHRRAGRAGHHLRRRPVRSAGRDASAGARRHRAASPSGSSA